MVEELHMPVVKEATTLMAPSREVVSVARSCKKMSPPTHEAKRKKKPTQGKSPGLSMLVTDLKYEEQATKPGWANLAAGSQFCPQL